MRPPLDWNAIDLVVFDVDGTLYRQRRVRLAMLRQLAAATLRTRSLETLRILRSFRNIREALGDEACDDFLRLQYSRTAERHRCTADRVQRLAAEWLEERPLALLAAARYRHVDTLFAGLREAGKRIAVFSDYPAAAKLRAMGLQADAVVCASDPDVARLKPDPLGLQALIRRFGVPPQRALMVGDRFDRDAAAAQRAGVRPLIRSDRRHPDFDTFRRYDDPVFRPVQPSLQEPAAA